MNIQNYGKISKLAKVIASDIIDNFQDWEYKQDNPEKGVCSLTNKKNMSSIFVRYTQFCERHFYQFTKEEQVLIKHAYDKFFNLRDDYKEQKELEEARSALSNVYRDKL